MLTKIDLAALAEDIEAPYRPVPVARLGHVEASLFICQGATPWHRRFEGDEILFVLEGVISVDDAQGKLVVNEGEVVHIPGPRGYNASSAMRSTVILVEDHTPPVPSTNGYRPPEPEIQHPLTAVLAAVDARRGSPYAWLDAGRAGAYAMSASRFTGASLPYRAAAPVALIVFRGVLDYDSADGSGTVVGSNMLVMPRGAEVVFAAERGATVLLLSPDGTELPQPATPNPAGDGSTSPDEA